MKVRLTTIAGTLLTVSMGCSSADKAPGMDVDAAGGPTAVGGTSAIDSGPGTGAGGGAAGAPLGDAANDAAASDARQASSGSMDDVLRLNHLQVEGTHNSYHVATVPLVAQWQYTDAPLPVQLDEQGVRQFELDVHYDSTRGFLVFHVFPDIGTTCETFVACITALKQWSDANPGHHALFVLIEPKDELDTVKIAGHYGELEEEILQVWPRERVLAPDDVRGSHATLRDAVTSDGWPTLGATRNKIVFSLNGGTSDYVGQDATLAGRLLFPRAEPADPFAAMLVLDDATNRSAIEDAVRAGFMVRTRYNGDDLVLDQAVLDDALESGAHFVSGDYPSTVSLPGGTPSRCNPVTAPPGCIADAL